MRTFADLTLAEKIAEVREGDVVSVSYELTASGIRGTQVVPPGVEFSLTEPGTITDLRIVTPVLRVGDRVLRADDHRKVPAPWTVRTTDHDGAVSLNRDGVTVFDQQPSDCERLPQQPEPECVCSAIGVEAECPQHGSSDFQRQPEHDPLCPESDEDADGCPWCHWIARARVDEREKCIAAVEGEIAKTLGGTGSALYGLGIAVATMRKAKGLQ